MRTQLRKRYKEPFLAWTALVVFLLLAFIVLIAIETLTREYPEWHWWMSTVPVNVFSDAFMPVVNFAVSQFSIPLAVVTLLLILSHELRWIKVHRLIELTCYILSISILWFGFWLTGLIANYRMLSLQSDGGAWGPCGDWAWFSRPLNTFIWHTILWIIWSVLLIGVWIIVNRRLLSNGKSVSLPSQAA
jgi:hypothetical protein